METDDIQSLWNLAAVLWHELGLTTRMYEAHGLGVTLHNATL